MNKARIVAKVWEFMDLSQGSMTAVEYATKFKELARYAPKIIAFDDTKKKKFMHGLRLDIVTVTPTPRGYPSRYFSRQTS